MRGMYLILNSCVNVEPNGNFSMCPRPFEYSHAVCGVAYVMLVCMHKTHTMSSRYIVSQLSVVSPLSASCQPLASDVSVNCLLSVLLSVVSQLSAICCRFCCLLSTRCDTAVIQLLAVGFAVSCRFCCLLSFAVSCLLLAVGCAVSCRSCRIQLSTKSQLAVVGFCQLSVSCM